MSVENQKVEKNTLVYISAASHSGSTLSTLLIASHPEMCTIGELKASNLGDADKYRCSCLKPIKSCEFWGRVNQRMSDKLGDFKIWEAGTNFSETNNLYARRLLKPLVRNGLIEVFRDFLLALSPSWRRELQEKLARNFGLIQSLCEITGKRFIVDSSKIGMRLKFLLKLKEMDIKVVRIIRDGRGVALTYINPVEFADSKNKELRAGGFGGDRDQEKLLMNEAAREWKRSNEEAEAVLRRLSPENWIQIRYEDICNDTIPTLNKIYRFLGVTPINALPNFRSTNPHVIGNGMRLDSGTTIQLDDRWKDVLSKEQLQEFDSVAGALNRKYGYV